MTHQMRQIASGFSFLESPRWWDGALYVSDFYTHRVLRFDGGAGDGALVCEVPSQPSGLAFTPDGDMLVVSMLDRTLRRWDGEVLHTVADLASYATGPLNDMTADRSGRVWIGNFGDDVPGAGAIGPTSIVSVSPDGKPIVAAEGLNFPNGMVLAQDGAVMLVAETFAARISAFDVQADGTLTGRRTWADFGGPGDLWDVAEATRTQPVLPDGIALDTDGALWVGDAKGRGVLRVGEGGVLLDRIDTGELAVYAAGLGGAQQQELFMCCAPPLGTDNPATSRAAVLLAATIPDSGAG